MKYKKIIASLSLAAMLLIPGMSQATLYNYYKSSGRPMPSHQQLAELAAEFGIFQYRGTAEQNILLEQKINEFEHPKQLGFNVVTRYKTTLRSSMTSTQTTIPVASITTFDGHVLTMADLGQVIYLDIEPGAAHEEIVKCTSITSSQWSNCTRGLAFYGTSESPVAANQFAHNAGSSVVMSNVHYVYEQFVSLDADQTITGIKTFTNYPLGPGTAPTSSAQLADKAYVDGVGAGGFTAGNIGDGKTMRANGTLPETLDINTSTALSAPSFVIDTRGKFSLATSTGSKVDLFFNDRLNATTTLSGPLTIGGNATTTGTMDSTGFCISGANCITALSTFSNATSTVATTTVSGATTGTVGTFVLPANSIGTDGWAQLDFTGTFNSGAGGGLTINIQPGGTTACTLTLVQDSDFSGLFKIIADNTTGAQGVYGSITPSRIATTTGQIFSCQRQLTAIDTTANQNIIVSFTQGDSGDVSSLTSGTLMTTR